MAVGVARFPSLHKVAIVEPPIRVDERERLLDQEDLAMLFGHRALRGVDRHDQPKPAVTLLILNGGLNDNNSYEHKLTSNNNSLVH